MQEKETALAHICMTTGRASMSWVFIILIAGRHNPFADQGQLQGSSSTTPLVTPPHKVQDRTSAIGHAAQQGHGGRVVARRLATAKLLLPREVSGGRRRRARATSTTCSWMRSSGYLSPLHTKRL